MTITWLFCLFLVTFVVGTDDFVIAGVLPTVADNLHVSEAAAGQLVTAFSLTYAVAAPVMAVATARLPRKTLLVGALSMFAVGNLATALAPSYAVLLVLRVLTAIVAATLSPAAFALVGRLVAPERIGRAMGTVAAGLTVSLVAGVPAGTWVSATFGWRSTFLFVAVLSGVAVTVTAVSLPHVPGASDVAVQERLRLLRQPAVLLCVVSTVLGASGGLMTYVYIAPITHDLTGVGGRLLAVVIAVVGIAGAVGTAVGGRLTDWWGVDRALVATFAALLLATAALAAVGVLSAGSAPVWLVAALLALWAIGGWGFNPPMNARVLRLSGAAGTESVALNTSGLYVGVAVAGALGGTAVTGYGGTGVLVTATVAGVVGAAVTLVSVRRHPSAVAAAPRPIP